MTDRKERPPPLGNQAYLVLYNLCQLSAFAYMHYVILMNIIDRGFFGAAKSYYAEIGDLIKFCHQMQVLEIVHPMLGITKGNALTPMLQLLGRSFCVFGCIGAEPRMQIHYYSMSLYWVYTLVEMVRYSYYITHVLNLKIKPLIWLRYTIWYILYPLGWLLESLIIVNAIPYFERSGRFNVELPNEYNIAFNWVTSLKIYLPISFYGLYFMMSYMQTQRAKVLGYDLQTKEKST